MVSMGWSRKRNAELAEERRLAALRETAAAVSAPAAVSSSANGDLLPRLRGRLEELAGDADLIRDCRPGTTLAECDVLLHGRADAPAITRVGCCLVRWIATGCEGDSFEDWALGR